MLGGALFGGEQTNIGARAHPVVGDVRGGDVEDRLAGSIDRTRLAEQHTERLLRPPKAEAERLQKRLVGGDQLAGSQLVQPAPEAPLAALSVVVKLGACGVERPFRDLHHALVCDHGQVRSGRAHRHLPAGVGVRQLRDLDPVPGLRGRGPLGGGEQRHGGVEPKGPLVSRLDHAVAEGKGLVESGVIDVAGQARKEGGSHLLHQPLRTQDVGGGDTNGRVLFEGPADRLFEADRLHRWCGDRLRGDGCDQRDNHEDRRARRTGVTVGRGRSDCRAFILMKTPSLAGSEGSDDHVQHGDEDDREEG